jgi:hypothetical protein
MSRGALRNSDTIPGEHGIERSFKRRPPHPTNRTATPAVLFHGNIPPFAVSYCY